MRSAVRRQTKESTVDAALELGGGDVDVAVAHRFLEHMLRTWCRYGGFGLRLRAEGDLEHHLVEDVAIVLGQCFRKAHGGAPCRRIASDTVVMDDAWVDCGVDLVDRPYYEGPLPVPLWDHWFRSFAMEARLNLHLHVRRGRDPHHAVEASFKAFGRALRSALEPRAEDVSLKGDVRTEHA